MKFTKLHIIITAVLSVGFYFLGYYVHLSQSNVVADLETARLTLDGQTLRITTNTNEYYTSRNFVISDILTGDVITTLSVSSLGLKNPEYRIVKGRTHDWLVVRKVSTWGTGMQQEVDEWYVLDHQGRMKIVLSYQSKTLDIPFHGKENNYLHTEILTERYTNDDAVDIRSTKEVCLSGKSDEDRDCLETVTIAHYEWDAENVKFVRTENENLK